MQVLITTLSINLLNFGFLIGNMSIVLRIKEDNKWEAQSHVAAFLYPSPVSHFLATHST